MPRTMDELKFEQKRLGGHIRAMASKNDPWTTQDRERYDKVTREYDAVKAEIGNSSNFDDDAWNQLKNQAFDGNGRLRDDGPQGANPFDLALCGWARQQMGQRPRERELEACSQVGLYHLANEISIRFPVTLGPMTGQQIFGRDKNVSLSHFRNAQGAGQGTKGGFTIRDSDFGRELEMAMLYSSSMLQVSEIMRTDDGRPLPWPTSDDTSNEGELIGESTEVGTQDATFGVANFGAHKISSKLVKASSEILRDSNIGFAAVLGRMLGERVGRKLQRECTTGVGGGHHALGIVTASTAGKTTNSATAIVFDELIDLMHSVDVSYRDPAQGTGWMMHDLIAAYVRKLKDGNGNYLWEQSTQLGQPDRLLGWPVYLNNYMQSTVATATKTLLFGALRKYKIRLVAELRVKRLVERYAEFDQEGFIAFQEFDGCLLDAGVAPVKHLLQA